MAVYFNQLSALPAPIAPSCYPAPEVLAGGSLRPTLQGTRWPVPARLLCGPRDTPVLYCWVSEPGGSRFVDAAGIEKPSVHPIAYKLFDLRGRDPQRGGVLGPILCDQRA